MIATDWTYDMICPIGTSSNKKHKTQASEQGNIRSFKLGYMIILLFLMFFGSCGVVIFKNHR